MILSEITGKDNQMKEETHKFIQTVIGEFSFIKIEISGSQKLINKLDIAIHKILDEDLEDNQ